MTIDEFMANHPARVADFAARAKGTWVEFAEQADFEAAMSRAQNLCRCAANQGLFFGMRTFEHHPECPARKRGMH